MIHEETGTISVTEKKGRQLSEGHEGYEASILLCFALKAW
jgi:hypothetical protein